jgi:hypothetical protein
MSIKISHSRWELFSSLKDIKCEDVVMDKRHKELMMGNRVYSIDKKPEKK